MTTPDPKLVLHSEYITGTGSARQLNWIEVHTDGAGDRLTRGSGPVPTEADPNDGNRECERVTEVTTWCTPAGVLMKRTCVYLICDGVIVSTDCEIVADGSC